MLQRAVKIFYVSFRVNHLLALPPSYRKQCLAGYGMLPGKSSQTLKKKLLPST
jgi:hypothetical protein